MRTHELLREGEWSLDGRLLTTNTVTWPHQIPVIVRGFGNGLHLVGMLRNIRREGSRILGDTDVTIGAHMVLTCTVDFGQARERAPGRIEMTDVRLSAAYVSTKDTYPWKHEEGGEAG
jgi:hypothetical protein